MKDLELKHKRLFKMVEEENIRQIKKWGIQNHKAFEWLAFTIEELGELSEAIADFKFRGGLPSQVVNEAIQVATLSLKIAEMFLNSETQKGKTPWSK
jgi:NTP pyrophosphatase (non-canonical NTP hydrolase)